MRTLTALLIATLILTSLGASAQAGTRHPSGPCVAHKPIKPSLGGEVVRRRVRHLIACSVKTWHVPGGIPMALCIARHESGPNLWPWADSGSSKGTFQLNSRYFYGWRQRYWERRWARQLPGWFNPRGNVVIGIRMARAGGWGPWTTSGGC